MLFRTIETFQPFAHSLYTLKEHERLKLIGPLRVLFFQTVAIPPPKMFVLCVVVGSV